MSLKEINKNFFSAVIITALFLCVTFPLLGLCKIYQVAEAREGVVVNSMIETGELILPLRHAELIPSKPPLFHWFSYGLYKTFGKLSPDILRLTSLVFAAGIVYSFFLFCSLLADRKFAWIASLFLITTVGFRLLSADARVDMVFYFFNSLPILLWFEAYAKNKNKGLPLKDIPSGVYRNVAILTGLSLLAKGPLGFLVPLLVILTFLLSEVKLRELKYVASKNWLWTLIIGLPWYVAATIKGKSAFFDRQIVFENFTRFFGGEGISVKPWWFYFEQYVSFYAPWSVLLVLILLFLLKELKDVFFYHWENKTTIVDTKALLLKFSVIWFLTIFLFISISAGKRSAYLLMIILPFNLILAFAVEMLLNKYQQFVTRLADFCVKYKLIFLLLWLFFLILPLASAFNPSFSWLTALVASKPDISQFVVAYESAVNGWTAILFVYAAIFFLLSIISFYSFLKKKEFGIFFQAFMALVLFLEVNYLEVFNAIKGVTHTYQNFAEEVSKQVPKETKLTFIKRKRDESFDGFFFYMNRTILLFEPTGDETLEGLPKEEGYYLARESWIEQQIDKWTVRISKVSTGGRLIDKPEDRVVLFKLGPVVEESVVSNVEVPVATENPTTPQTSSPYAEDDTE
ncbi:MAG: glycosyltransferase family 39 protein [Proteobacteria bacterium]|nr:glycosyltransferase family 39 protein [Pseudomonadota bacterium]